MDIRNLKERHQELIDHMIAVGYSSDYIQHIRHEIRNILENPDNWDSYEDLIESYMQKYDLDKAQHLRSRIRLIARFDLEGILPRDPDHPKDWNYRDSAYQHLNDEFMGLIDYYIEHADFKVKKETTYQNEASNAASFLLTLQNRGVKTLAEIDENYIVDILTDENGVPSKSGSYTGRILAVFKGSLEYSAECGRIVHILPSIKTILFLPCIPAILGRRLTVCCQKLDFLREFRNSTLQSQDSALLIHKSMLRLCNADQFVLFFLLHLIAQHQTGSVKAGY